MKVRSELSGSVVGGTPHVLHFFPESWPHLKCLVTTLNECLCLDESGMCFGGAATSTPSVIAAILEKTVPMGGWVGKQVVQSGKQAPKLTVGRALRSLRPRRPLFRLLYYLGAPPNLGGPSRIFGWIHPSCCHLHIGI